MNCETIEAELQNYLEGDMNRHEAEQVRRHLAECAACHRRLDELWLVVERLEAAPILEPPVNLRAAVRERLPFVEREPGHLHPWWWPRAVAVAMSGFLGGFLGRSLVLSPAGSVSALTGLWRGLTSGLAVAGAIAAMLWNALAPVRSVGGDLATALTRLALPLLGIDLALLFIAISAAHATRAVRARLEEA